MTVLFDAGIGRLPPDQDSFDLHAGPVCGETPLSRPGDSALGTAGVPSPAGEPHRAAGRA